LNSSITQAPKSNLKFVIQQNTACFYIPAAKQTQHSLDSILLVAETNSTLLTLAPYPANLPIVCQEEINAQQKKKTLQFVHGKGFQECNVEHTVVTIS
jgi:hypothetical protein